VNDRPTAAELVAAVKAHLEAELIPALTDARLKAVLDQLRERVAGEQARTDLSKGQQEAQTTIAQLHEQETRAETSALMAGEQKRWLLWGTIASSLVFVFVLWRVTRRKPSYSLLPAKSHRAQITGTVISCPSCTSSIVLPLELIGPVSAAQAVVGPAAQSNHPAATNNASEQYWRERALAAESQAQRSNHVLRAALIPHLARWLMNNVVRRLTFQRTHLLETQQKAEQELAELDQRLFSVKAPLEERLRAYQERITELEKDLTAKGKENRELIEATIAIAKKKLELERSKERMGSN